MVVSYCFLTSLFSPSSILPRDKRNINFSNFFFLKSYLDITISSSAVVSQKKKVLQNNVLLCISLYHDFILSRLGVVLASPFIIVPLYN